MSENESFDKLNKNSIEIIFNNYLIKLNNNFDSIQIFVKLNEYDSYQSNFKLNDLNQLLNSNYTNEKMIEFILNLIGSNNINIELNKKNLIFRILNDKSKELILYKNSKLSEEIIEKLITEINDLKKENKKQINELRKQKMIIEEYEKKIIEIEKRIKFLEEKNKNNLMNSNIRKKINNKNQIIECDLMQINSIKCHSNSIESMAIFLSGNIITVSSDESIKIWDMRFNILQIIQNAHSNRIINVSIKDEDNFATSSNDRTIKTWIKINNLFQLNIMIENVHDEDLKKIIYCPSGNIISCSEDKTVKIWELINNKYQLMTILDESAPVKSLLLLNDKNILVTAGLDGTKFWKIKEEKNINFLCDFKEAWCGCWDAIDRMDENRIIIGGLYSLIIISLLENNIIVSIENEWRCNGIKVIENKGIFLVSGWSKNINIYRSDNYECIKIIENAHDEYICGFIELTDNSICSFSINGIVKVWNLLELK